MDMGQDVARATQGLGSAVSQVGATIDAYNDKRYDLRFKAAKASHGLAAATAEETVAKYQTANPSDHEGLLKVKNEAYAKIWDETDTSDLRPEHLTDLQMQNELIAKKGDIKWGLQSQKIKINNDNSSLLQSADALFRAGDYEGGIEMVEGTTHTEAQQTSIIQQHFTNAKDSEALGMYNDADSIEKVDQFIETLEAKGTTVTVGEGDDTKEITVHDNFEVIHEGKALGGISQERRAQLKSWAESKKNKLTRAKHLSTNRALRAIARNEDYKGEILQSRADFAEEDIERLEDLHVDRNTGEDMSSQNFTDLEEDLNDMRGQVGSFWWGVVGKSTQPIKKLDEMKDQIFKKGAFTAQAKSELFLIASEIEAELATHDEVEYNKTAIRNGEDYNLSDAESAVWVAANARVKQLVKSIYEDPRIDQDMAGVGTSMMKIREEIFNSYNDTLTDQNYQQFIETTLPNIIQRNISPVITNNTDKQRF